MPHIAEAGRPQVFLSFDGNDRCYATGLRERLRARGIDTFVDKWSIGPAQNLVIAINDALDQSDYFVLLWSSRCIGNTWVEAEWTTALMRQLDERRSFLFMVRLDNTEPPRLLAPRSYLDALGDWDAVADKLADTWNRDLAVGLPVLPAPGLPAPGRTTATAPENNTRPVINVYVRNRDLSVTHAVKVPAEATGWELDGLVRASLKLKDIVTELNGKVGMRFSYQLKKDNQPIPADKPLTALPIEENSTIDLHVETQMFGPDGPISNVTYMTGEAPELNPEMMRTLINSAFGHLIPRPPRRHRRKGAAPGR